MNAERTGAVEAFAPGAQVGNYRIVRKVGEGGFGQIYLAEQTEPVTRKVALKVLKAGMDSPENLARFEIEHRTLAMMNHPSIAVVYEAGLSPSGSYFIVMEWVDGQSITEYCTSHDQQGLDGRLELFIEICRAVHHAHQRGVIHRDIKPANILVAAQDGRPAPKIIDFGIAKLSDLPSPTLTGFGQPLGTPEYMSPEQIAAGEVDTRSDVYSLGAILFELLTGTALHHQRDTRGTGEHRVERPSTRVVAQESTRRSGRGERGGFTTSSKRLIGDLDWIVMKALENEPDRRYESAAALAADIERHLRHEPVSASPPTRIYLTKKFLYRHRRGVAAATLSVLSLVAGSWFSTAMAIDAREARAIESEKERIYKTERDLRQSRQREAERMAGVMIDTLEEDLWASGRFGLVEAVIHKATRHFELQSDNASSASRRLDVSIIWAASARLNLSRGKLRQAKLDLRRAIEIRQALVSEWPGDPAFASALADAFTQEGELALAGGDPADAQGSFSRGLELYDRLIAQSRDADRSLPVDRAGVLCGQAESLRREGALEFANATLADALRQLDPLAPGPSADAEIRCRAHLVQAAIQIDQSDPESAERTLDAARQELAPRLAADPQQAVARHLLSRLESAYAGARLSRTELAEEIEPARLALDSSIANLDALLRGDPENVLWRYDRFRALRLMGRCLQSEGFLARARDSYEGSLVELQALREQTEELLSWQYDMATTRYDLAGAELEDELLDRAEGSAREALAGLAGASSDRDLRWRVAEALARERLGEIENARSPADGASGHYTAALEIYEDLPGTTPDRRAAVARLLVKIAGVDRRSGKPGQSQQNARHALELYLGLSDELPSMIAYQAGLANCYLELAAGLDVETEPGKTGALDHLRNAWDLVVALGGEQSTDREVKKLSDTVWHTLKNLGEVMDREPPSPDEPPDENAEPENPEFLRIARDVGGAQNAANRRPSAAALARLDSAQAELDNLIAAQPDAAPTAWLELKAAIFSVRGQLLNQLRQPSAAAKQQEQGIALRHQLLADKRSRQDLAFDLNALAITYQSLRRFGQSEAVLDEAVAVSRSLLEEIYPERPAGVIRTMADSHYYLAKVMEDMRKPEAAEEHAVRALELRDEVWSGRPAYANWITYVAISHAGLGRLLGAKDADASRYGEAERHYLTAIEFQGVLAEQRPENPRYQDELAKVYNSLGLLYLRMQALDKARTVLDKALVIREKLPQDPLNRRSISAIHNSIALTAAEAGNPGEAEKHYLVALGIRQKLVEEHRDLTQFTKDLANLEDNLGNFYLRQGKHAEAEPHLVAALDCWTAVGSRFQSATVRYLLGKIHCLRGEWKEAASDSRQAKSEIEQYLIDAGTSGASERRALGLVCSQLGEILQAQNDLDGATAYLERAQAYQEVLLAEGHAMAAEDLAATKQALARVKEISAPETKLEE